MPNPVNVTINTVGTTHTVSVDPDPVRIPVNDRAPVQWKITNPASQGWKFQVHGIDIVNPGTEFHDPSGGGMRVFTWKNNHRRSGTYKYAVRVESSAGTAEIDPIIMND